MVQNVEHWLLDRDNFRWAREQIPTDKWYQITKYFPGYIMRRQMMYVDADTGQPVSAEGGEVVPAGKVYIYGYDLRNFCGIEVPGLDDAMTATRKSRLEQRGGHGNVEAKPAPGTPSTAPGTPEPK